METNSRVVAAKVELEFDDAVDDSPIFRASLQRNEDELDELSSILDTLVKSSRSCLEYAAKLADALGRLAPSINRMSELVIFDKEKTPTCLSTIIEFVETTFVLHERLVRDLGQRLLIPLIQSVQDDLREIRDQRRQQDKWREKYDALLAKYNSLPKLKEYALIREDTYLLYEGRRQYYDHLFTYIQRINKFRRGADLFFVDKCLGTMETLRDFACSFNALVEAFKTPSRAMRMRLGVWQREAKRLASRMEDQTKEAMTLVSLRHSPDAPYKPTEGVAKRGHLCRKRQKTIGPGWKRVWLCINDDCLVTEYSPGGRRRGQIEQSFELHVLLCEIKPWDGDRRHCFEITTSRRSLVYQAETEEDMRDWLRVFENAKAFALQQETTTIDRPNGEMNNDDGATAGDESVDETLSLYSRSVPMTPRTYGTLAVEDSLPFDSTETLLASMVCMWQTDASMVALTMESKENSGKTSPANAPRPAIMPQVNTSSLSLTSNASNNGNDASAGASFGRLYGTERSMYLCSDLFGVEQRIRLSWVEIQQLNYKLVEITGLLTLTVAIGTTNETVRIQTISDESMTVDILRLLWKNCRSTQPKTAVELKESLTAITGTVSGVGAGRPVSGSSSGGTEGKAGTPGAARCKCESHLERNEYDAIIPLGLEALTDLLFSTESAVYKALIAHRRYKGIPCALSIHLKAFFLGIEGLPPWTWDEDEPSSGKGRRSFDFVIPVNHPLVKLKETECHEDQWIKNAEGCVSVLQEAKTPAVIYGDAFMTQCLFCLTNVSTPDEQGTGIEVGRTRLRIFTGVRFVKNPFVKSMIRSNTLKGLADYVADVTACLWGELRRMNPDVSEEKVEPSVEEQEEEARLKAETASKESRPIWGALTSWIGQVADNGRSVLADSKVSPVALLLSFAGILMMLVSTFIYWRAINISGPLKTATLLKELSSFDGALPNFFSPRHRELYEQLDRQRKGQQRAYCRLQAAERSLKELEHRLARSQYAVWMADRLSECYATARIPTRDCIHVEKRWRRLLDGAEDSKLLIQNGG